MDDFFLDLDDYIFKYYNDGISEVPMIINGTMGHNSFLPAIYPLSNLCDASFTYESKKKKTWLKFFQAIEELVKTDHEMETVLKF